MLSIHRFRRLPPNIIALILQTNIVPRIPISFRAGLSTARQKPEISLSNKKFKSTLEELISGARNPSSWDSFSSRYERLLSQFQMLGTKDENSQFISSSLTDLMSNLTERRTPNRLVSNFVASIFHDIRLGKWGVPLVPDHYYAIIRARAQNEDFEAAEGYLQQCLESFPTSSIPSRVYIALLGEYRRYNEFNKLWRVYKSLRRKVVVLDPRIYQAVQDALIAAPKEILQEHILELQGDFRVAKLGDIPTLTLLLETFRRLDQKDNAKQAAEKLERHLEGTHTARITERKGWEALLLYKYLNEGVLEASKCTSKAKAHGYRASVAFLHRTVNQCQIRSAEKLRECEVAFGLPADTIVWSLAIQRCLAYDGTSAALDLYYESRMAGIPPAAYMVHPLIRALCGGHLRHDLKWPNIERALEIYSDLVKALESRTDLRSQSVGKREESKDIDDVETVQQPLEVSSSRDWPGPDSMIYDTILRAIAQYSRSNDPISNSSPNLSTQPISENDAPPTSRTTPDKETSWNVALGLLNDMRRLNIPMSPMVATAITILLMRIAPTFEEAFSAYRSISQGEPLEEVDSWRGAITETMGWRSSIAKEFSRFELTAASYENLIRGFCTLKPKMHNGALVFPPAELYLQMVKDMQLAGHPITEDVYMTFIFRLGRQAGSLRLWQKEAYPETVEDDGIEGGSDLEELIPPVMDPGEFMSTRQAILHGIRTMHNHIVLNAGITPSIDLLNAMLNAYNKVAAVHDAFKVWDTISLAKIYNTTSISIILDTCGWGKVGHKASQIWNKLVREEFPLVKNNWDSRVECLCRLGRLDDALKVVCLEMPHQNQVNAALREQREASRRLQMAAEGTLPTKIKLASQREREEREGNIIPDMRTLHVLFSFATKTNQVEEVRDRVRRYLPEVWATLPAVQKEKWS